VAEGTLARRRITATNATLAKVVEALEMRQAALPYEADGLGGPFPSARPRGAERSLGDVGG
jgi:hypothetical protein